MTIDPRTPVIVGAGQVLHRDTPGAEPDSSTWRCSAAARRARAPARPSWRERRCPGAARTSPPDRRGRSVDLYSCFPAAVEIAAAELGLPLDDPDRPLTVTGGLTFAGDPGNNYAMHAIATLVGVLREHPDEHGLATALGWYLSKHAVGVYSAQPPACTTCRRA